jgi:hypothetical protein
MPSGGKQLIWNGLERAVSSDQNRAQSFMAGDRAEIARWLMNVGMGTDDLQASSGNVQNASLTAPLSAEVHGGLCVRPITGSMTCTVDAGSAYVVAPDTDPDASNYKLATDPGVNSSAPLVITANSSGQIRIDVVECSYSLNANAETDNRDVFNPATGAFVATTVPKASQGGLLYRVRAGTPGSGYPAAQVGWLPLAVVSVPSGAANVAGCTFWDVRPLVADRVFAPSNLATVFPRPRRNLVAIDTSVSGKALLSGYVETSATDPGVLTGTGLAGGYRLGGTLGAAATTIDLNLAANQSGTPSAGPVYVYLLEPFGLPRWAQYRTVGGALVPTNPRGIPVVTSTQPTPLLLTPSAALALPTATGLGGTTSKAVCIGCSLFASGVVESMTTGDDFQTAFVPGGTAGMFGTNNGTFSSSTARHVLVPGTDYPAHATALEVSVSILFSISAGPGAVAFTGAQAITMDATFAHQYASQMLGDEQFTNFGSGLQAFVYTRQVKVPIPLTSPVGLAIETNASVAGGTIAFLSTKATVAGWCV